jgi:hypothetical protein
MLQKEFGLKRGKIIRTFGADVLTSVFMRGADSDYRCSGQASIA